MPDSSSAPAACGRVLALGRSPDVMAAVLRELAELGVDAEGSTEPETVAAAVDVAAFDVVAFGGGLAGPLRERLRGELSARNPALRFVDASTPQAVRQIMETLSGQDGPQVDLDAYFARIGYDGPRAPTLATLAALQERHIEAIPFEGIDAFVGAGVDIAPAAVDAKLIAGGRGGYCYEQNGLFKRVLTVLGFEVEGLMARVKLGSPPGALIPRSHMTLRVTLDGEAWLADVGFGRMVPPAPLRFGTSEPQPTRHEPYRLIPFGPVRLLQAWTGEAWEAMYEIANDAQLDVDYEPANWFTTTHPSSLFRRELVAARTTPEERIALFGARLTTRRPGATPARTTLDADGLEHVLAQTFGIAVDPAWRGALERVATRDAG